jgi:DNA-binding NtrC family response regulator
MAKNIFIVEDEGILTLMNTKYLKDLGHTVVGSANNAADAIIRIKMAGPDIILMDIKLKGPMDGIDAIKELEKFSKTPVIYVTGNSEPDTYKRAQETHMLDFLIKPISMQMLKASIDKHSV